MDIDLKLLRAFVAVAREGNVTRAAAGLHLSQSALSKQLARLEQQLEADLFIRGNNGATLTRAGEELLLTAPHVLAEWDVAGRRVRHAASAQTRCLIVGFVSNAAAELTGDIVRDFTRTHPDIDVRLEQADWSDPTAGLATGRSDAALVRLPLPVDSKLSTLSLMTEPMCLAVPAGHHLAERRQVRVADILDERFVATRGPAEWRDWWLGKDVRGGHTVQIGATVGTPDEWIAAIIAGRGVSFAFVSAGRYYAQPGIAYIDVTDLPPSTVAVAWRSNSEDELVEAFVSTCRRRAALGPTNGRS